MKTHSAFWPLTLAAVAIVGSLASACMMPYVAVATIAAATMPRGAALVTTAGAWATSQMLGFGLLGYPLDGHAIAWGVALGACSLAVVPLAARIAGGAARDVSLLRVLLAGAAGFALTEGLLFGFALVAGGLDTFTPAIVGRLLANEAAWLAILVGVHLAATRSAPRLFGATRIARLA